MRHGNEQPSSADGFSDLESQVIQKVLEQLTAYCQHLVEPDPERALILITHITIERLLAEMISASLPNPDVWLEDSDYRSRTNLARALNLIGDSELNICRVLGSARNQVAHKLELLEPKWRVEILRLAAPSVDPSDQSPSNFRKALRELIGSLALPWLRTRVQVARRDLIEANQDLWHKIGREHIRALPEPLAPFYDDEVRRRLLRDLDDAFAAELAALTEERSGREIDGPA
jgi:hypothetical protein